MNKLNPVKFRPLPLGHIHPLGWLAQQLRIQADGISGKLDEFWPDVKESRWFGGDKEAWERAPYWLDGVIPLAYVLDDEVPGARALKAKVTRYMDYIIRHQGDDGWLGPREMIAAAGRPEDAHYDLPVNPAGRDRVVFNRLKRPDVRLGRRKICGRAAWIRGRLRQIVP